MIRLLFVEDNPDIRLKIIPELTKEDIFEVVGQADTTDLAFALSKQLVPDIVLLDLHLPGLLSLPELIKRLVNLPNVAVVAYASSSKPAFVQDYLDLGVKAYMDKSDSSALLKMSMVMVNQGKSGIISPSLPKNLTKLTPRQRLIVFEITKRGKIAQAATRLNISVLALMAEIDEIIAKLELKNPEALLKWAKKHGF